MVIRIWQKNLLQRFFLGKLWECYAWYEICFALLQMKIAVIAYEGNSGSLRHVYHVTSLDIPLLCVSAGNRLRHVGSPKIAQT